MRRVRLNKATPTKIFMDLSLAPLPTNLSLFWRNGK
jgi:hypothetical protein